MGLLPAVRATSTHCRARWAGPRPAIMATVSQRVATRRSALRHVVLSCKRAVPCCNIVLSCKRSWCTRALLQSIDANWLRCSPLCTHRRFVLLQFVEVGGDLLDQLMRRTAAVPSQRAVKDETACIATAHRTASAYLTLACRECTGWAGPGRLQR